MQKIKPLTELRLTGNQHAGTDVVVSAEIFGATMDNHIGAEVEGALQDRGEKCVVDGEQDVAFLAELAESVKVGNAE